MTIENIYPVKTFHPPRRRGAFIHGFAAILLAGCSGIFFLMSVEQKAGTYFVEYLLLSLIFLIPLPFVLYRGYSLLRARYVLDREGLRLHWGLRSEEIPLSQIEWIRAADEIAINLPLPFLYISGSIRASYEVEDMGPVEYMASDVDRLLLIATSQRIFAISPDNVNDFVYWFREAMESGSLSPMEYQSTMPDTFLSGVWHDRAARVLVLSGIVLSLTLLSIVSLIVPGIDEISIGYDATGSPLPPLSSQRLFLLPVLSLMIFAVDLIVGAYYYRNLRPISYLIWGSGILTPLLLLLATWYML